MTSTPTPQQFGPYSPIRTVANWHFVSGQVGVDPASKRAEPGIAAQTKQALENMKQLLQGAGLSMNHVVKTTVFLVDMDDFVAMNSVYETYFDVPRPARSAVAVQELPRVGGGVPLRVEIEAIICTEATDA